MPAAYCVPVAADDALGARAGVARVALLRHRVRGQVHVFMLVGVHLTQTDLDVDISRYRRCRRCRRCRFDVFFAGTKKRKTTQSVVDSSSSKAACISTGVQDGEVCNCGPPAVSG